VAIEIRVVIVPFAKLAASIRNSLIELRIFLSSAHH